MPHRGDEGRALQREGDRPRGAMRALAHGPGRLLRSRHAQQRPDAGPTRPAPRRALRGPPRGGRQGPGLRAHPERKHQQHAALARGGPRWGWRQRRPIGQPLRQGGPPQRCGGGDAAESQGRPRRAANTQLLACQRSVHAPAERCGNRGSAPPALKAFLGGAGQQHESGQCGAPNVSYSGILDLVRAWHPVLHARAGRCFLRGVAGPTSARVPH
mmetsp:Transcript_533/g.1652  ORF Transcript_533/g.1652 Transcript_533/m.1652 type:complete len:214 (-) Transcript_533:131-772(-)